MNEQAQKATKRTRRWLKVSLRTFLVAITVLCVWLGFIVNRANKQKRAVAWVQENGGAVLFDFQWDDDQNRVIWNAKPPGPDWLREWIGVDYYADVKVVHLVNGKFSEITTLAVFTDLEKLNLFGTKTSDISPLARMTRMEELNLCETQVSNLSPLGRMTRMRELDVSDTQVSDLSPLTRMKQMQSLFVENTQVSNMKHTDKVVQRF